jgi:hypothetical protein
MVRIMVRFLPSLLKMATRVEQLPQPMFDRGGVVTLGDNVMLVKDVTFLRPQ